MKPQFDLDKNSVEDMRRGLKKISKFIKLPRGTSIVKDNVAGMPAEWVSAKNVSKDNGSVIMHLHGGAILTGGCDTHRDLAARISNVSGLRVLLVEYRLAPEHKYPAANEDCISAYNWLIKMGIPSNKIIIGGDSAGGFLTLMTLISLRDQGYPLPAATYLLSYYGDVVNFDGESYITRANLDPCLTLKTTRKAVDYYFDAVEKTPPILSPLRQNLEGLPPLFVQVGDHEIFLSDSTRLAERAQDAGVDITLEIWENMWHVFQGLAIIMPESKRAIKNIGCFINNSIL